MSTNRAPLYLSIVLTALVLFSVTHTRADNTQTFEYFNSQTQDYDTYLTLSEAEAAMRADFPIVGHMLKQREQEGKQFGETLKPMVWAK